MTRKVLAMVVGLGLGASVVGAENLEGNKTAMGTDDKAAAKGSNTMVTIKTSMGDIKVELCDQQAPITVSNFLQYVDAKFYTDTIFHRVIPTFMIQGGGFTKDMKQKPTKGAIRNEAGNGLKNKRGTLAMARTPMIHSATAQFFINVKDNAALDHRDDSDEGFGYCVFGRVTAGMDVVDKIKAVKTGFRPPHGDVPVEPVTILEVIRTN